MIEISWDIRQDLQTGDWLFDSRRDLQSVEAEYLIQQRVHVRLMVERGEFIYDRTGTLGSRLRSLLSMGVTRGGPGLEQLIREALEPMDDIAVSQINIFTYGDGSEMVTDPRVILARVEYTIVFTTSPGEIASFPGQYSTDVPIPV